MKMYCLVSKVSTKYKDKIVMLYMKSFKPLKRGISRIFSHVQNFNLDSNVNTQGNVAEWFHAKSPSLARCKEGDLRLLNFSNLTCLRIKPMGNTTTGSLYNELLQENVNQLYMG